MTTSLVQYKDSISGADVELSIAEIKKTICPKATDQEAGNFLRLCQYMGLNPFVNDAYLIKYGDGPASMVVGKDAFTKRADAHPQFAGIESGVVIQRGDSEPTHRKGTLVLAGEVIVGGWAKVARNDRKLDVETTVSFNEFSTGRAMWNKMPGTMIEKVAIVKSLRTAFPATFSGLYDQAEMGIDMSQDLEPEVKTVQVGADGTKHPDSCVCQECFPVPENAPGLDAQLEPAIIQAAEALGAVAVEDEPSEAEEEAVILAAHAPHCDQHDVEFEWMINPDTDQGGYVHQYEYEAGGSIRKGWHKYSPENQG